MVLKDEIDIDLWEVIQKNYESDNFTGAILDAIFKLTDTIRNKTGLEGDGASLIGQAFGGENPQIKLNKLQTDSEKDVQKGIQEILRGIYSGIRNPRSHDSMTDDRESAEAIIIFIGYLLKLIDQSKLRFNEEDFLKRVFDPYYVQTKEYSELLVREIPKRQRANIAIEIILQCEDYNINSLSYFCHSLFDLLEPVEISRVYKVVSDKLRTTTNIEDIKYILHLCPAKYWNKIEPAVRIRTEAILQRSLKQGSYNPEKGCSEGGALATWITGEHLSQFGNIEQWTWQAVEMLKAGGEKAAYIDCYLWNDFCFANKDKITFAMKSYIKNGLNKNDPKIIEKVNNAIACDKEHPWWEVFKEELTKHPEIEYIELPDFLR